MSVSQGKILPGGEGAGKPKLLDVVRRRLREQYYALRTEEAYVGWIRRYVAFHRKRHPRELGEREVSGFLSYLAVEEKVSASTQNQALSALLFLYTQVLERPLGHLQVDRAQRPRKLPVVLTKEEVRRLREQVEGVEWLMVTLLYGSGLRLLELLRLRVKDVDLGYLQITVREGKGEKDRRTMMPVEAVEGWRRQLERRRLEHAVDVAVGGGAVYLPYALERKYPGAARAWEWQYVFAAGGESVDPRSGERRRHHVSLSVGFPTYS